MDDNPPASPRLLFALWLSEIVVFIGLLCEVVVGVFSAKLVMSSRCAAWFGAATKSSFDTESWRELPPCSGDIPASNMSMSLSWEGEVFPFISEGWWGCWAAFTPSSSSLESAMKALRLLPLLDPLGCSLVPSPNRARLLELSPPPALLGPFFANCCFSVLSAILGPLLVSVPVLRVVLVLLRRGISNLGVSVAGVLWECGMVSSGLGVMLMRECGLMSGVRKCVCCRGI